MKREELKLSVYCKEENISYAGKHLLIEMWQCNNISSAEYIKEILREAVTACSATIIDVHTHTFSPYDGVSGIAVLKESHISIHTWPEFKYAAIDIFVCGNVDPYKALPVFKRAFDTENVQVVELKRGIFDEKKMVF